VRAKTKIDDVNGGFQGKLADGDWFGAALDRVPDLDGDGRIELAVARASTTTAGSTPARSGSCSCGASRTSRPPRPSRPSRPRARRRSACSSATARRPARAPSTGTSATARTSTAREPQHTYAAAGSYTSR
jgi:hypothetical protein